MHRSETPLEISVNLAIFVTIGMEMSRKTGNHVADNDSQGSVSPSLAGV